MKLARKIVNSSVFSTKADMFTVLALTEYPVSKQRTKVFVEREMTDQTYAWKKCIKGIHLVRHLASDGCFYIRIHQAMPFLHPWLLVKTSAEAGKVRSRTNKRTKCSIGTRVKAQWTNTRWKMSWKLLKIPFYIFRYHVHNLHQSKKTIPLTSYRTIPVIFAVQSSSAQLSSAGDKHPFDCKG